MQFRDLEKQYQIHQKEIDQAISSVLLKADFIGGHAVSDLEEVLSEYVGKKHCITCANGTDALQLSLMAWGIGEGDAVFVPDFTFFSSGEVVSTLLATPVFVDVDPKTFNIDPDSLREAIDKTKKNTKLHAKVIVSVDLFGLPANYQEIRKIAEENNLLILEDGAQGFGGRIGDKKACSFGDISTTSFFPAKPLGCYGDGGAIFTDDDQAAAIIRSLKVHGKGSDKYDNVRIGMNSRLDTIQAAVLLEKFKFFEEEVKKCNIVAEEYSKRLQGVVEVPQIPESFRSSWAQYTVLFSTASEKNKVVQALKAEGIPTAVYYQKPMHLQKAFDGKQEIMVDCENTVRMCETCLSLPMHPYLETAEIDRICKIIVETLEKKA